MSAGSGNAGYDRDLFGFMRAAPSRLTEAGKDTRLIQTKGGATVWAVLTDGTRAGILSEIQFERAGFDWDAIEIVTAEQLDEIPVADRPLNTWE